MEILLFQRNQWHEGTLFNISYYKALKKYLIFLGQYPDQAERTRKFSETVMVCSLISLLIPGFSQLFTSIAEKDMDATMECVPLTVTTIVCMIKLLNHSIHKDKFDKSFRLIKEEWDLLNGNNGMHVLDSITKQGNKLAELYRIALMSFMVVFLFLPLAPPVLDVLLPLNESRPRQQMFKLNYFIDEDKYFYFIYLHSSWCSFVVVIIVVSIDSLYMLIVHHCCGLFAVCGYQIKKRMEHNDFGVNEISIVEFKQLTTMHKRTLQFYNIINECNRSSFLLQVGLNMIGITVTAIQMVMYLHQPEEAIRIGVFLVAQQFHLLTLSIPGQSLIDYSLQLVNDIYDSRWYQIPVNIQKMLHIMQIRSCKVCKLTAGGLYEMNIANFGTTFKTCMSYFTVLLSFKD